MQPLLSVKLLLNGSEMEMVDDDHYSIDLNLKQGDNITADIPNFDQYWIDPDFFEKNEDGSLKFLPIDGTYRVIANLALNYLEVLKMNGTSTATLNDDGTGALWIIGDGIGKPSVATNAVGWTTEKGLCMSQIEAKKYQVTVVAGEQTNLMTSTSSSSTSKVGEVNIKTMPCLPPVT